MALCMYVYVVGHRLDLGLAQRFILLLLKCKPHHGKGNHPACCSALTATASLAAGLDWLGAINGDPKLASS